MWPNVQKSPQRNDLNGCVLLIFGMGTFESINEDHVHRTMPCFSLLEAGICLGNPVLQPKNKSKTKICGNPMTLHFIIFKRVQQAHFLGCFKQLTRVEPAKCRATLFHICPWWVRLNKAEGCKSWSGICRGRQLADVFSQKSLWVCKNVVCPNRSFQMGTNDKYNKPLDHVAPNFHTDPKHSFRQSAWNWDASQLGNVGYEWEESPVYPWQRQH